MPRLSELGVAHFTHARHALADYEFESTAGRSLVVREPVGVCALITPLNWPLNGISCKVAPALATGCTMVLKPSELAPISAMLLAEVLHEAGVPAGVFNLVNGDGPTVGAALARHPDVDMISFTGSTRAGIEVAKAAADAVKRVTQELGGKSANIILDDADLKSAITRQPPQCPERPYGSQLIRLHGHTAWSIRPFSRDVSSRRTGHDCQPYRRCKIPPGIPTLCDPSNPNGWIARWTGPYGLMREEQLQLFATWPEARY